MTKNKFQASLRWGFFRDSFLLKPLDGDQKVNVNLNDPENDEIMSTTHYYPFGMEWDTPAFDVQGNSLGESGVKSRYTYNGNELVDDLSINLHDYGARYYDPAIGRWTSVDPLAEDYIGWSTYNYVIGNPLRYIDPDGRGVNDLIVKGGAKAVQSFKDEVFNNSGGFYQADIDSKGNVTLSKTGLENEMDGDLQMSDTQSAFATDLENVINSNVKTEVELVYSDASLNVGDIIDNKIDMADIAEFDKAGPGVASSAGALSHELIEQHEKAKAGGTKGVYPSGALDMHKKGIKAEDRANGNKRRDNLSTGQQYFFNKDGSVYEQHVTNTKSGTIKVTKTKVK